MRRLLLFEVLIVYVINLELDGFSPPYKGQAARYHACEPEADSVSIYLSARSSSQFQNSQSALVKSIWLSGGFPEAS